MNVYNYCKQNYYISNHNLSTFIKHILILFYLAEGLMFLFLAKTNKFTLKIFIFS